MFQPLTGWPYILNLDMDMYLYFETLYTYSIEVFTFYKCIYITSTKKWWPFIFYKIQYITRSLKYISLEPKMFVDCVNRSFQKFCFFLYFKHFKNVFFCSIAQYEPQCYSTFFILRSNFWAQGVNFTNILWAHFSYKSSFKAKF